MTLLWVLAAWVFVAGLTSVLLLAVAVHRYGTPPLLDGRPLLSALDEHAHERQTLASRIAEDESVAALDAVWDLPARSHP